MKTLSMLAFLYCAVGFAEPSANLANCLPEKSGEEVLIKSSFKYSNNLEELKKNYLATYNGLPRQKNRLYFVEGQGFYLPIKGETTLIAPSLVERIQKILTKALDNTYADFLFYPDMGHFHLLNKNDHRPIDALNDAESLFLIHTGELLKLKKKIGPWTPVVDDPWLQWRYYSRNLVAQNSDPVSVEVKYANKPIYNTISNIDGYKEVANFSVNANKNGCLSLATKNGPINFDIGLE